MLEDDFSYVFRKALMRCGLAPSQAAAAAGIPETAALALLRGDFSTSAAASLAPVVGLRPDAFAGHPQYHPAPLALAGVHRLDLPFSGEQVNAWLVRTPEVVLLFDAGFDSGELRKAVQQACGRLPDRVFITHDHRDHVGAVDFFLAKQVPVHAAGLPRTREMRPGDSLRCGPLTVTARDLRGHASPALGFLVSGLDKPVLVTGDALFAGSIGGCPSPEVYRQALGTLHETLADLPAETVLLPGHGPATTIGEERESNPFL